MRGWLILHRTTVLWFPKSGAIAPERRFLRLLGLSHEALLASLWVWGYGQASWAIVGRRSTRSGDPLAHEFDAVVVLGLVVGLDDVVFD
jgi:hypothetical protein